MHHHRYVTNREAVAITDRLTSSQTGGFKPAFSNHAAKRSPRITAYRSRSARWQPAGADERLTNQGQLICGASAEARARVASIFLLLRCLSSAKAIRRSSVELERATGISAELALTMIINRVFRKKAGDAAAIERLESMSEIADR